MRNLGLCPGNNHNRSLLRQQPMCQRFALDPGTLNEDKQQRKVTECTERMDAPELLDPETGP